MAQEHMKGKKRKMCIKPLLFNFLFAVDIQYFISFMCTGSWLDIYTAYKRIPFYSTFQLKISLLTDREKKCTIQTIESDKY